MKPESQAPLRDGLGRRRRRRRLRRRPGGLFPPEGTEFTSAPLDEVADRLDRMVQARRPSAPSAGGTARPATVRRTERREVVSCVGARGSARTWSTRRDPEGVGGAPDLDEEVGQADRGRTGVAGTIAALNAAQVQVLLVRGDADDERTAWFCDEAVLAGARAGDLDGLTDGIGEARLADVLIRSALAGAGAQMLAAGHDVPEGVGAILRWA